MESLEPQKNTNKNKFESNKKYFTICIYVLCVIALGSLIIYWIMNMKQTRTAILQFLQVLSPFTAAFLIAYILNPIVKQFDVLLKKYLFRDRFSKTRKITAILISYFIVIGIIAITIKYVTPQIDDNIQKVIPIINEMTNSFNKITDSFLIYLKNLEADFPDFDLAILNLEERFKELIPSLINQGTNLAANIVPFIYNISMSIAKLFINTILAIVISCYMLADKKTLTQNAKRILYALLKEEQAGSICKTLSECNKIFSNFIIGKSIDSLIIGVICFILMSIFRFPYAALLSVIVGITNMIPYFGPFIGAIPGVLLYLFVSPLKSFLFAILILALQQFDGLILGPKILGDSTGLKPLWIIFAITVGGAYFGVLGMFLGVPIVAVISYLLNTFISKRLKNKNIDL